MSEPTKKSPAAKAIEWGLISILVVAFAAAVIPYYLKAPRYKSAANGCLVNLRQIDAAVYEWALENGKTNGMVVTANDIKPYVKLDVQGNLPKCPNGGIYIYGRVGSSNQVTCSLGTTVVPAHVLP